MIALVSRIGEDRLAILAFAVASVAGIAVANALSSYLRSI